MLIEEESMKKQADSQTKRRAKKIRSNPVKGILKVQKHPIADTALELVEVYEAVERTYRAAGNGRRDTGRRGIFNKLLTRLHVPTWADFVKEVSESARSRSPAGPDLDGIRHKYLQRLRRYLVGRSFPTPAVGFRSAIAG